MVFRRRFEIFREDLKSLKETVEEITGDFKGHPFRIYHCKHGIFDFIKTEIECSFTKVKDYEGKG